LNRDFAEYVEGLVSVIGHADVRNRCGTIAAGLMMRVSGKSVSLWRQ